MTDLYRGTLGGDFPAGFTPGEPGSNARTDRSTRAAWVQEQLDKASDLGYSVCVIPQSALPYDASAVDFPSGVRPVRPGQHVDAHDVRAYGADPDATHPSHLAVQSALDAAEADDGTASIPPGRFIVDQTVELTDPTNLTVEGPGELVYGPGLDTTGGIDPLVKIVGGEDVVFRGVRFQGTGNDEVQHNEPGLQVVPDTNGQTMRGLRVVGCVFREFSTWGLRLQSGPFGGAQPDTIRTRDWRVQGSTFKDCVGGIIYGEGSGTIRGVVTENIFRRCAQHGIKLDGQVVPEDGDRSGRIVISDNIFNDISGDHNPDTALQAPVVVEQHVRGVEITGNVFSEIVGTAAGAEAACLWISDGATGENRPVRGLTFRDNLMEDLTLDGGRIVSIEGAAAEHRDLVFEGNTLLDTFDGSFVVNVDADLLDRVVVRGNTLHALAGSNTCRVVSCGAKTTSVVVDGNVVGVCDALLGATSGPAHRVSVRGNTVVDGHILVEIETSEALDYVQVLDNEIYQTEHGSTAQACRVSSAASGNDDDFVEVVGNVFGPNQSTGSQTCVFIDIEGGRFRVNGNMIHDGWQIGVQTQTGAGGEARGNILGAMGTDGFRLNTSTRLSANSIESAGSFLVRNPGNAAPVRMDSILNFTTSMGDGTDDPTADAPSDWIAVQIDGAVRFLPAYT